MARTTSLPAVRSDINSAISAPDFGKTLHDSLASILQCLVEYDKSGGAAGWSMRVPGIGASESVSIERAMDLLSPVVDFILGKRPSIPQYGGAAEEKSLDDLYEKLDKLTSVVDRFSQQYGATKIISDMEARKQDFYPAEALKVVPPLAWASELPVSPRGLIVLIYTAVDITRVILGSALPGARKILSVLVAVADLLRGDWKKAILSFAGFFGQSPMIIGVFGKLVLDAFMVLDPEMKRAAGDILPNTLKSFVVGVIIQVFQTFAPALVRDRVEEGFAEIRQMTLDPETAAIAGEGLPAKSAYLRTISFQDIQNLQSILSDKTKVCTDEFQSAIEGVNSSAIMRNLLWLLRIPSDEASRIALCGTDHVKSYSKTLADDRVAAEPASKPAAENPVAMPEDAAKPAAENPAAMPEDAAKPAAENPAAMPEASAPESAGTMPATAPTEMPEAATTKKTGGKRRRLLRKRY
jgi:hypothetical protein